MNRIAWLGQAAVCYNSGVPSRYSSAWSSIDENTKEEANKTAFIYLNKWLNANGLDEPNIETALSIGRQVEIY